MRSKTFITTITLFLVLLLAAGCGKKQITSESLFDRPDYHVSQGLSLLDRGDTDGAKISFERALDLDPEYAEAYSGLALVAAMEGDFKVAHKLAEEGIDEGRKNAWTYVVHGRIYTMERKDDNWLGKAEKQFEKAIKYDPDLSEAYFWWGVAKKEHFDFDDAAQLFSRTITFQDEWAIRADNEFQLIQKIQRAAPGSTVGKKIALVDQISRAELAVLFSEELKLREVMEQSGAVKHDTEYQAPKDPTVIEKRPMRTTFDEIPEDIEGHWAKSWIEDILEFGIMELSPDQNFYPDELVTRAEYALFLQHIMVETLGDESFATHYIGERSRFKDMRGNSATYNAAALCVDRNIMDAYLDGTFRPLGTVSGADALLAIRELQNQLRMTF